MKQDSWYKGTTFFLNLLPFSVQKFIGNYFLTVSGSKDKSHD